MGEKDKTVQEIPTDQAILKELRKTNKILALSNGQKIEEELGKYATSDERKMIWVLIDGKRQVPEIVQIIKKTKDAVNKFLQILENADLIEERAYGKPPMRAIDYVPARWVDLVSKLSTSEQPQAVASSADQTLQQEVGAVG